VASAAAAERGEGAWFRLPIGRHDNADPKWLVPLICRLGHVTKRDIGLIKIFDRETKFEISPDSFFFSIGHLDQAGRARFVSELHDFLRRE